MSARVEAHAELNGQDVIVIGSCSRDMTSRIACEIEKVLLPDGTDVTGIVPESHMPALRTRLACAHIAQAHRGGDEAAEI